MCLAAPAPAPTQQVPSRYDLYLRADGGRVSIWVDTATGDFRWLDPKKSIDLSARGTLAFPNLGPMMLWYAGEAPGYDWAIVALKVYGTVATGSLTLFPTGERSRRTVSLFHDRDTRDDVRPGSRTSPRSPTPEMGELHLGSAPEIPTPAP